MGRTALYRKYRPRDLSEIVGQEHITEVLAGAAKSGGFSHAYLLTGPRGIGKTSVARILAHLVNETLYGSEDLDIIEIDAASHGAKDDVKELIERSQIAPTGGKHKVYIIDEVHSMKHDAFNTFLKLLEEPPSHVVFILATTDPQKLPATILSRTQRFHFRPVEARKVIKHLEKIAQAEQIKISDEALALVAQRSEGSLRDAVSLLDQLGSLGREVTAQLVEEVLGLAPNEKIAELAEAVKTKNSRGVVDALAALQGSGLDPKVLAQQLTAALLDLAPNAPQLYEVVGQLLEVPKGVDLYLKMLAVLGAHTATARHKTPEAPAPPKSEKPAELAAQRAKPIVTEKALPKKPAKNPPEPPKPDPEPEPDGDEHLTPIDLDWGKVLATIKAKDPLRGGFFSNAKTDYDGETLTIFFNNKMARTKAKDLKIRTSLLDALTELYGVPPKIAYSETDKPKNATISKVADIMGGGEVL